MQKYGDLLSSLWKVLNTTKELNNNLCFTMYAENPPLVQGESII